MLTIRENIKKRLRCFSICSGLFAVRKNLKEIYVLMTSGKGLVDSLESLRSSKLLINRQK